jgi:hypothetical protein
MSKGGKLSPSDFSDDTRKLIRSAVEAALPKNVFEKVLRDGEKAGICMRHR